MKLTEEQIELMKEEMSSDLIGMLMEQWHCSLTEAMTMLYNSDTFLHMQDTTTDLYYQSPGYVYSYLDTELRTGQVK